MTEAPGFFIPYRHAATTTPCDYPALAPHFSTARQRFAKLLRDIDAHRASLARFGGEPPAPRFEQDWFPRLDACAAYAIARDSRPQLIVEIGSGHSTRVMVRAMEDGAFPARIVCIDPAPRATIAALDVQHRPLRLDELAQRDLALLAEADLLFIDSSHVAVPGSDVDRLVNDVLPRLAPGTLVHFHDIFLPHAYPEAWAWRGYNEQLLVGALLGSGGYELLFSSSYVVRHMKEALAASFVASLPLLDGAFESSLWLRKQTVAQSPYQNVSGR